MKDFFATIRRIAEPVRSYRKLLAIHIFYRVFLVVIWIFVANRFGKIVELTTQRASFDLIFNMGTQTIAAVLFSYGLAFLVVGNSAGQ